MAPFQNGAPLVLAHGAEKRCGASWGRIGSTRRGRVTLGAVFRQGGGGKGRGLGEEGEEFGGGGAVAAVWRGLGPFGEFSAHFSQNGEKKEVQLRGGGASSDHAPSPCADW